MTDMVNQSRSSALERSVKILLYKPAYICSTQNKVGSDKWADFHNSVDYHKWVDFSRYIPRHRPILRNDINHYEI